MKTKKTLTTTPIKINGTLVSYSATEIKQELLKCRHCGTPFINGKDIKTGKISKYLWVPNCKCMGDNFMVSMG